PSPPSPPWPLPPKAKPPTARPPSPPSPPLALPLLRAVLPMSCTALPVTTPTRLVVATAELELNESATLVVAVLLLSAAALPSPRATAMPRLSRLLPLLSSLNVELLSPRPDSFCWDQACPEKPSASNTAVAIKLLRMRIVVLLRVCAAPARRASTATHRALTHVRCQALAPGRNLLKEKDFRRVPADPPGSARAHGAQRTLETAKT